MSRSEELTSKSCVACDRGTKPMTRTEAEVMLPQVSGWTLAEGEDRLTRRFRFPSFKEAIDFVNRVAELAEVEGHHPDIYISWDRVRLEVTTHSIKGLSVNDFILAAKISMLM